MSIKIGLVGTGTVGGGCVRILQAHRADFIRHHNVDLELVRACSCEPDQARDLGISDIFTYDYHDIINDPSIDIVIELIGGTTVAKDVVLGALKAGKYVVTANKALMATYGHEVLSCAEEQGKEIAFEASVGGGIPIIGPLKHSLVANEIYKVMGIVNGTTNFILTCMADRGMSYDEALRKAQANGYAEADPTADVDGLDAAAKIAILASIAFNRRVTLDDVHTDGIRSISPMDLETARDLGYVVKLLAIAQRSDAGIEVRVHPTMIPADHQLASVNGVFNAIYVVGDSVGEAMFFGEGAGSGAAASAVMGDVIELARHLRDKLPPEKICTCTDEVPLLDINDLKKQYYIRFKVTDRVGVLSLMSGVFAKHGVSIHSVLQRGRKEGSSADLIYITHVSPERNINAALEEMSLIDNLLQMPPSVIRVEA